MNERVRTFFAVALPEEAREAAAQLAGRLREKPARLVAGNNTREVSCHA